RRCLPGSSREHEAWGMLSIAVSIPVTPGSLKATLTEDIWYFGWNCTAQTNSQMCAGAWFKPARTWSRFATSTQAATAHPPKGDIHVSFHLRSTARHANRGECATEVVHRLKPVCSGKAC